MNNKDYWDILLHHKSYDIKNKKMNAHNIIEQMLSKTLTMFLYYNLPDTIPSDELEKSLQIHGNIFIFEYVDNLIGLPITLLYDDVDVYGRAKTGTVYLQDIKEQKKVNINDGVLIKNDFLQIGLFPILNKYSHLISDSELTLYIANIWKRASKLLSASDDPTIQSAKEYVNKIEKGEISVIATNPMFESLKVATDTVTNVSLNELIQYDNYIKSLLYNEIGLNYNKNMKKERLITSEVTIGADIVYPFVDNMFNCRKIGIKKLNKKYGLNVDIEFTSSWEHRPNLGENLEKGVLNESQDTGEDTGEDTGKDIYE